MRRSSPRLFAAGVLSPIVSHEIIPNLNAKLGRGPKEYAVWMHGIMGTKKNLRTIAQAVLKTEPAFSEFSGSVTLEHRGHGKSHGLSGPNTVDSCARDLEQLLLSLQAHPRLLCSHSFGGKVALTYLRNRLDTFEALSGSSESVQVRSLMGMPRTTWILDSLPGIYAPDLHDTNRESVFRIIKVLGTIPEEFESRSWFVNHLLNEHQIELPIAQWLGTGVVNNLTPLNGLSWKEAQTVKKGHRLSHNMPVVNEIFDDFCHLA